MQVSVSASAVESNVELKFDSILDSMAYSVWIRPWIRWDFWFRFDLGFDGFSVLDLSLDSKLLSTF